jgi:hypothetical protein
MAREAGRGTGFTRRPAQKVAAGKAASKVTFGFNVGFVWAEIDQCNAAASVFSSAKSGILSLHGTGGEFVHYQVINGLRSCRDTFLTLRMAIDLLILLGSIAPATMQPRNKPK